MTLRNLANSRRGRIGSIVSSVIVGEPAEQTLESALILGTKHVLPVGIDIEYRDEMSRPVEYRNDNLRSRPCVTGNMPGKLVDVRDDDRRGIGGRRTAYTTAELDVEAAECSLIRANTKQPPWFNHSIKTGPEVLERMMDQRADGRHRRDGIVDSSEHALDLRLERGVSVALRKVAEIKCDFSHWNAVWVCSDESLEEQQKARVEQEKRQSLDYDRGACADRAVSAAK